MGNLGDGGNGRETSKNLEIYMGIFYTCYRTCSPNLKLVEEYFDLTLFEDVILKCDTEVRLLMWHRAYIPKFNMIAQYHLPIMADHGPSLPLPAYCLTSLDCGGEQPAGFFLSPLLYLTISCLSTMHLNHSQLEPLTEASLLTPASFGPSPFAHHSSHS